MTEKVTGKIITKKDTSKRTKSVFHFPAASSNDDYDLDRKIVRHSRNEQFRGDWKDNLGFGLKISGLFLLMILLEVVMYSIAGWGILLVIHMFDPNLVTVTFAHSVIMGVGLFIVVFLLKEIFGTNSGD